MQKPWNEVGVEEQRFTLWRNPTDTEQRIDIFEGPGRRKRYVLRPGEEARIPSEYDRGIHDVRNGVTVGGYAPRLERVSGATPLAPALEPPPAEAKPDVPRKAVQAVSEQAGGADRAPRR